MAYEELYIPEENRSNILPSRLPNTIKAYYDGSQSMLFTNSISPSESFVEIDPSTGTPTQYERLDYFDLNNRAETISAGRDILSSWFDFYSWPTSGITIQNPEVKENYVDIPGANGSLDFSEALTGYPLYQNRTGSVSFEVDPYKDSIHYTNLFARLSASLHGRKKYTLLVDEVKYITDAYGDSRPVVEYAPWYYEGRLKINSLDTGTDCNKYTLNYTFDPFKKLLWTTSEDFVWDNFDFDDGIDYQSIFKDITITAIGGPQASMSINIGSWIGTMPTIPSFKMEATSTRNQCLTAMGESTLETGGDELGMYIRVRDARRWVSNPQDSGYIWVPNNTQLTKEPRLVMAGTGIDIKHNSITGEPESDLSIVLSAYGVGSFTVDMQIGVI